MRRMRHNRKERVMGADIEYETVLIPCRDYDPPSLRCWPCAHGRSKDCEDPIVKRVPKARA